MGDRRRTARGGSTAGLRRWAHALGSVRQGIAWSVKHARRNPLTRLADAYGSDKGFRKHLYTRVYHELLRKAGVESLLEIGLLCHADQERIGGGSFVDAPSLEMWHAYLPSARVYGFDIKDFSRATGPWTAIVRGDQSNRTDLERVARLEDHFDVIIDDGLHASHHQQVSLSFLFSRLSSGGLYFIEDLHFQPVAEQDFPAPLTLPLLKELAYSGTWSSPVATGDEKAYLENHLREVMFFDSMRSKPSKSRDALAVLVKA